MCVETNGFLNEKLPRRRTAIDRREEKRFLSPDFYYWNWSEWIPNENTMLVYVVPNWISAKRKDANGITKCWAGREEAN